MGRTSIWLSGELRTSIGVKLVMPGRAQPGSMRLASLLFCCFALLVALTKVCSSALAFFLCVSFPPPLYVVLYTSTSIAFYCSFFSFLFSSLCGVFVGC